MHKKIMKKCAKQLMKDAGKYEKQATAAKGAKDKEKMMEKKEALSAAKMMESKAKKAHGK